MHATILKSAKLRCCIDLPRLSSIGLPDWCDLGRSHFLMPCAVRPAGTATVQIQPGGSSAGRLLSSLFHPFSGYHGVPNFYMGHIFLSIGSYYVIYWTHWFRENHGDIMGTICGSDTLDFPSPFL